MDFKSHVWHQNSCNAMIACYYSIWSILNLLVFRYFLVYLGSCVNKILCILNQSFDLVLKKYLDHFLYWPSNCEQSLTHQVPSTLILSLATTFGLWLFLEFCHCLRLELLHGTSDHAKKVLSKSNILLTVTAVYFHPETNLVVPKHRFKSHVACGERLWRLIILNRIHVKVCRN